MFLEQAWHDSALGPLNWWSPLPARSVLSQRVLERTFSAPTTPLLNWLEDFHPLSMNWNIRAGLWLKNSQGKSFFFFLSHSLPMFNMDNFPCSPLGNWSIFLAYSWLEMGPSLMGSSPFNSSPGLSQAFLLVHGLHKALKMNANLALAWLLREKASFCILSGFLLSFPLWPLIILNPFCKFTWWLSRIDNILSSLLNASVGRSLEGLVGQNQKSIQHQP